jgi:hypothetical protein
LIDEGKQTILTIAVASAVPPLRLREVPGSPACDIRLLLQGQEISLGDDQSYSFDAVPPIIRLSILVPKSEPIPDRFTLRQNYPNPFNPSTSISYQLPEAAHVRISIIDVLGREIEILKNDTEAPGFKEVTWNAASFSGGLYFCRFEAVSAEGGVLLFTDVRKLLLLR